MDEPTFCNLLQVVEPKFQLPHRTFVTTKVLPESYSEVRMVVEKQLATVEKCSITTDLWTSQYQHVLSLLQPVFPQRGCSAQQGTSYQATGAV